MIFRHGRSDPLVSCTVIPAQAGIQSSQATLICVHQKWIPAFAGTSGTECLGRSGGDFGFFFFVVLDQARTGPGKLLGAGIKPGDDLEAAVFMLDQR
jgi:hypothetical protein